MSARCGQVQKVTFIVPADLAPLVSPDKTGYLVMC
jgi:hypothetical protein